MRASFYQLSENRSSQYLKVCSRLAEKAYRAEKTVFVRAQDDDQLRDLDELMWSFSVESFLPHSVFDSTRGSSAPVSLSLDWAGAESSEIWINLSPVVAPLSGKAERVLELVKWNEDSRAPMRQRYTDYQRQGFEMDFQKLD